jgi:L-aminoadipate-semialdehyde dehydrogenase
MLLVFVPLKRMPLNPNGKVDKPALPFPDTALAAAATVPTKSGSKTVKLTPTEQRIHDIWQRLLPGAPPSIPTDESFFDLGGHSILATRLIFEIRKTLATNAPLGLVFSYPTIAGLARALDELEGSDFGLANGNQDKSNTANGSTVDGKLAPPGTNGAQGNGSAADQAANDYAADAAKLIKGLPEAFKTPESLPAQSTVFLTGATGFLGAFILYDLLSRTETVKKVICHVRAKDSATALQRLKDGCQGRGVWSDEWLSQSRLEVVVGDLENTKLGMSDDDWEKVAQEADAIMHNGAVVHWVYPYSKLRAANVGATLDIITLAQTNKAKPITFISTTAVFETPTYYLNLSDAMLARGKLGVPESDPLDGSLEGLTSGYGQSKWVAERILMECGRRGLRTSIVRPSYVLGDSKSAVTNTDDFVWRLVKGCIQLGLVPDIYNTINLSPVDHVAHIAATALFRPTPEQLKIFQVTARPNVRFNDFLSAISKYGYKVQRVEYLVWRTKLEQYVMEVGDNALFPLLHYVLDDLPTSTKSPELDDTNTAELLEQAGDKGRQTVDDALMGKYLAWLVKADFLPLPTENRATPLPELENKTAIRAIGRTGGH